MNNTCGWHTLSAGDPAGTGIMPHLNQSPYWRLVVNKYYPASWIITWTFTLRSARPCMRASLWWPWSPPLYLTVCHTRRMWKRPVPWNRLCAIAVPYLQPLPFSTANASGSEPGRPGIFRACKRCMEGQFTRYAICDQPEPLWGHHGGSHHASRQWRASDICNRRDRRRSQGRGNQYDISADLTGWYKLLWLLYPAGVKYPWYRADPWIPGNKGNTGGDHRAGWIPGFIRKKWICFTVKNWYGGGHCFYWKQNGVLAWRDQYSLPIRFPLRTGDRCKGNGSTYSSSPGRNKWE